MRLTRRGWGVVAIVAFCLFMAQYGSRSLNALAAPLIVVGFAAVVTVYRTEKPTVWRRSIGEGFIGERRTVELSVEVDRPTSAIVEDRVADGLTASENVIETTLVPDDAIEYDVKLDRRGEHEVGPVTIVVRDLLGLAERRFEYRATESVLAYPKVFDLRGGAHHDLQLLADAVREYSREEFSHLREYDRADSLRDIHWKSTAKRADGELVVKEFVADEDIGSASIAVECDRGKDDEMAAAAASVATYLLGLDVSVGVTAPNGRVRPDSGESHHADVLRLLARAPDGTIRDRVRHEADVVITSDDDGTRVVVDGHEIPFQRLIGRGVHRSFGEIDVDGPFDGAIASARGVVA